MKTKKEKNEEAIKRNNAWAALPAIEKLAALAARPGESKKQHNRIASK